MDELATSLAPEEVVSRLRSEGKTIVFLGGFSSRGYRDRHRMLALVRCELMTFAPDATIVASGATASGVGAAYSVARDLGFATVGIVSALIRRERQGLSPDAQRVFIVDDDSWGGIRPGSNELSPVSQAIVDCADVYIAVGGGEITRAEAMAAKAQGREVRVHRLADASGAWSAI